MNQEKIMKMKMIVSIILSVFTTISMCIFIALYIDEGKKIQRTLRQKYTENLAYAGEEINTYLQTGKDLDIHYNMLLSDIGTARNLVFLLDNFSEEKKKTINTFHYCLVKYPEQMKGKLKESKTAIDFIAQNIDKGYDELQLIIESVDMLGN